MSHKFSSTFYLFLLLFLFSCSDDLNSKYEKAVTHRDAKDYRLSNSLLNEIVSSPSAGVEMKTKSYFLMAQSFLDLQYYHESIDTYKKILDLQTDNSINKKSLFMIGYIYNNNLDMYTDSKEYYGKFKDRYPNDDLIPSVDYELDQIEQIISNIK